MNPRLVTNYYCVGSIVRFAIIYLHPRRFTTPLVAWLGSPLLGGKGIFTKRKFDLSTFEHGSNYKRYSPTKCSS